MNSLLLRRGYCFSLRKTVFDMFYMPDKSSESYQIINSSMHTKLEGVDEVIYSPSTPNYSFTKLPSGITVLTESICVPANVQLGLFVDVGSRD